MESSVLVSSSRLVVEICYIKLIPESILESKLKACITIYVVISNNKKKTWDDEKNMTS